MRWAIGLGLWALAGAVPAPASAGFHFPEPGETLAVQQQREPSEVGLDPAVLGQLASRTSRYALWRDGYLVAVKGDFFQNAQVASQRKTWHALSVGAALAQGRIPSLDQRLSEWIPALVGHDALATWRHALTQSASFVHPGCGHETDYLPGEIFTYADPHIANLNLAMARAFGRSKFQDAYDEILAELLFGPIGMQGWSISTKSDGVRLHLDLEDMGRLGLLAVARGRWADETVVPSWYVDLLDSRQTDGLGVDYVGCEPFPSEVLGLDAEAVPVAPYGFMTWLNADGALYPDADAAWAFAAGVRGFVTYWNHESGIVLAATGADAARGMLSIPALLDAATVGPNPWFEGTPQTALAAGDWIVAVAGEPNGAASRVLRVDPASLEISTLSAAPLLERPVGLALLGDHTAYVLDAGRLLSVDVASGQAQLVSEGGLLEPDAQPEDDPKGLAVDGAGRLVVADPAAARLVRIDPATGAQTLLSEGGLLVTPRGVARGPGGSILVADRCAGGAPDCAGAGGLVRVEASGEQTLLAPLPWPESVAFAEGRAYVVVAATAPDRVDIVAVDVATGDVSLVASEIAGPGVGVGFARSAEGRLLLTRGSTLVEASAGETGALLRLDLAGRRSTPLALAIAPSAPKRRCGLGFELAPVLGALGALAARRRRARGARGRA
jgi:hypothetical protein